MTMPSAPPMRPRKPDSEDEQSRTYNNVVFATRNPIPWIIGRLQLGRADVSRLQTSGVPVLLGHVPNEVVGTVTSVRDDGDRWRSNWRMPKIPATRDTLDRIDAGLLAGISVGGLLDFASLQVINEDEVKDIDDWIWQADWTLLEESLTAIPADVGAGIDRVMVARSGPTPDLFITPDSIYTPQTPELQNRLNSLMRTHNETASVRRKEQSMATKPEINDIPQELIERAIASQLARSETLKSLTEVPDKLDKLIADQETETRSNMEYRAKLDRLQFQPGGQVLQHGNWTPEHPLLDLGVLMRLTREEDGILPPIGAGTVCTLEESVIERAELGKAGRDTLARIPWEALAERERQLQLQRVTMANAAGARPLMIDILGNAGLVLSSWSPVMARMDVRLGVAGGQKSPWATTQMTAAAGAEGSDIPITNLILNNVEYLPVSIASAYELTSSLRGVDDGTFEAIARMAIMDVIGEQVTSQVLVGGGTDEIGGLWGTTGVQNLDYGANQGEFIRQDALDFLDAVRLSKTDGGMYTGVLSTTLWKLAESKLRGGNASDMYLLEASGDNMGQMEGEAMFHFADLSPSGITDPGLFFKANRILIWFWGNSLTLDYVPQLARKDVFKMTAEVNMVAHRPANNISRIKQD